MFKVLFLTGIALLIPLFFILIFLASAYHKLAGLRNRLKAACSQLDVLLERRSGLISSVVEIARNGFNQEPDLLQAILVGLNGAVAISLKDAQIPVSAQAMKQLVDAERRLLAGLVDLRALAEADPGLKANWVLQEGLQDLTVLGNKVASARQGYDEEAAGYNKSREAFPNNIIAAIMNLHPAIPFGS